MTDVQLEKSKFRETVRHNLAMELGDTNKLHESIRHNLADESISRERNRNDSRRLDIEKDKLDYDFVLRQLQLKNQEKQIEETIRHNKKSEDQALQFAQVDTTTEYVKIFMNALTGALNSYATIKRT